MAGYDQQFDCLLYNTGMPGMMGSQTSTYKPSQKTTTFSYHQRISFKGGGCKLFSELGLPEVAPCMAQTFGGVSGHRRHTGSEPHPAQIWSQK